MELALISKLRHGAIWRAMRARGWNQRQLGVHLGIDQNRVSMLLRFKWIPKDETILGKLMALTGVGFDDLFPPAAYERLQAVPLEREEVREVSVRQLQQAMQRLALPSPEQAYIEAEERAVVALALMSTLNQREQDVLRRRFGLDGEEQSLSEVARAQHCSTERIRQIEATALRKLKHPGVLKRTHLNELVEGETRRPNSMPPPRRQPPVQPQPAAPAPPPRPAAPPPQPARWYCYCHGWNAFEPGETFGQAWKRLHPEPLVFFHPAQVAAAGGRYAP